MYFIIAKFSPGDVTKARCCTDPMTVYANWAQAEAAAMAAQAGVTDGSQFAIFEAVAITAYAYPPVTIQLLGATVPTTI